MLVLVSCASKAGAASTSELLMMNRVNLVFIRRFFRGGLSWKSICVSHGQGRQCNGASAIGCSSHLPNHRASAGGIFGQGTFF